MKLFHVSEQADINIFEPRPSPSHFDEVTGDVVFAISDMLLHNYLLPRNCPRITYYATGKTTANDREKFTGDSRASYTIIVDSGWYKTIAETVLYMYEFPADNFMLLDECAGYYISYQPVVPIAVNVIREVIPELLARNIELRFTPSLIQLADAVSKSSLNYSMIRMRNAGNNR